MGKVTKTALAILLFCILSVGFFAYQKKKPKPKCDCYFPNIGKYGVRSGEECRIADCEPPKQKPNRNDSLP
jgi:hypothetical protein